MCFLLPRSLCDKLELIIARYWWQKGHGRKGIHWCSWKKACELKNVDGLGFRNMAKFNVALLAKQGYWLMDQPDSLLAQVLKARYYPTTTFLQTELVRQPSYTWKSIWVVKGILKEGLGWKVGTCNTISINDDAWLLGADNFRVRHRISNFNIAMVAALIDGNNRMWREELIRTTFKPDDADRILHIPLASEAHPDMIFLYGEHSGEFTVRSACKMLQNQIPTTYSTDSQIMTQPFYKQLWALQLPNKIKILAWKVSWNFIPTMVNLH